MNPDCYTRFFLKRSYDFLFILVDGLFGAVVPDNDLDDRFHRRLICGLRISHSNILISKTGKLKLTFAIQYQDVHLNLTKSLSAFSVYFNSSIIFVSK
jgi:hypothetical protein